MDKIIFDLAVEAAPFVEIRRIKAERKKLEALPPPEKPPADLSGWVTEMEDSLKGQMQKSAASIVHRAGQACEAAFSVDELKKQVGQIFHANLQNEIEAVVLLQYLPYLKVEMEATLFNREVGSFNSRFQDIDRAISTWVGKIPKPFSPEMINVEKRFPVSRVGFLQDRAYDKWLSDALKSKPIFFDSPDYVDKLILLYETIYKPLADAELKEREGAKTKDEVKPVPPPVGNPDPGNFSKSDGFGTILGDSKNDELFSNRHPRFGGKLS